MFTGILSIVQACVGSWIGRHSYRAHRTELYRPTLRTSVALLSIYAVTCLLLVHLRTCFLGTITQYCVNALFYFALTASLYSWGRRYIFYATSWVTIWSYLYFESKIWIWPFSSNLPHVWYLRTYYPSNERAGATAHALFAIGLAIVSGYVMVWLCQPWIRSRELGAAPQATRH